MAVIALAAAALFLGTLIGLLAVPINHPYGQTFVSEPLRLGYFTIDPPQGAQVSGSWSAAQGANVSFQIVDSTDYPIYISVGSGGAFAFPCTSPPYAFTALPAHSNGPVSVTV